MEEKRLPSMFSLGDEDLTPQQLQERLDGARANANWQETIELRNALRIVFEQLIEQCISMNNGIAYIPDGIVPIHTMLIDYLESIKK